MDGQNFRQPYFVRPCTSYFIFQQQTYKARTSILLAHYIPQRKFVVSTRRSVASTEPTSDVSCKQARH
jgi:hypothetical protein